MTGTGTPPRTDPVRYARAMAEHARSSSADTLARRLGDLEDVFPEPTDAGFAEQLNAFWTGWSSVANHPWSTAPRAALLNRAECVAATLRSMTASVSRISGRSDQALAATADSVTVAAAQLAALNRQIAVRSVIAGDGRLDRRDLMLDTISSALGSTISLHADGTVDVAVDGERLVTGVTAAAMSYRGGQLSVDGRPIIPPSGRAAAELTARTTTIPGYQAQLDSVADRLMSAVNDAQAAGFDLAGAAGMAMFSGSGAGDIAVALTDPALVAAASSAGGCCDGGNALVTALLGSVTNGPDAAYVALVGAIGSASALSQQQRATQATATRAADALATAASGVSDDAQVAHLLAYQRGHSAASGALTTIDGLSDTLVEGGASGRFDARANKPSSGRPITRPSDDPAGTVRALQLRSSLARTEQFRTNAADAVAWLTAAGSASRGAVNLTRKARTLIVHGLNSGASDANGRAALADQIDALRTSLLDVANTAHHGRPVFGGTTRSSVAYDAHGHYVGDTAGLERTVASGETVPITQTGRDAFGPAGADVFAVLSTVSTALRTDDTSTLKATLTDIDWALARMTAAQAAQRTAYNRIGQSQAVLTIIAAGEETELSSLQDIDRAEMAVQVTTAHAACQAALQITAAVKPLSLSGFLQ